MSTLERNFGALSELLRPEVQQFLTKNGGNLPQIEPIRHGLIIRNLPPTFNKDIAEGSAIMEICHQLKDLFCYGDRHGKKGAKKKLKHGETLENPAVRICITYTSHLEKAPKIADEPDKERPRNLQIAFWVSYSEDPTIEGRSMTDEEIANHYESFIARCQSEITEWFRQAYQKAFAEQSTINFCEAFG